MIDAVLKSETQDIVVDEVFPHSPETIWKTLTTAGLMGRWLMMPTGFEAVEGKYFTYLTTPAGAWDGTIHCQVLEVKPNERLTFAWKGGHEGNVGYGSLLDTVVTFILSEAQNGTRLRLIHSGFALPKNEIAFKNMSKGWEKVIGNIGAIADEDQLQDGLFPVRHPVSERCRAGCSTVEAARLSSQIPSAEPSSACQEDSGLSASQCRRGNEMSKTYTGGCACGTVRYRTDAAPIFENHCQCIDCRRRSGTGHGSYLTFARRSDMELSGEAREWRVAGDSGNEKIHSFCPVCGTPVYLAFAAMPELIAVHAGSLDDPGMFRPQALTYAVRGVSWDWMDPEIAAFEKMAPG